MVPLTLFHKLRSLLFLRSSVGEETASGEGNVSGWSVATVDVVPPRVVTFVACLGISIAISSRVTQCYTTFTVL